MRRLVLLSVGLLELCVAFVLLAIVQHLPSSAEVRGGMERAGKVGIQASNQLHKLQDQLQAFRGRQPELNRMTTQLEKHLQEVGKHLSNPDVEFESLMVVRDTLADAALGMEGLATALDPKLVGQLSTTLGATATYIEDKIVPTATSAADQLEASSTTLKEDAERVSALLRTVAADPESYRQGLNRLNQLDHGVGWVMERSTLERLNQSKDHLGTLQQRLLGAAREVERLAGQTYPVVSFQGLVPTVVYRPLWPEGKTLAEGLFQAGDMIKSVQQSLGWLAERTESYQVFLTELRSGVRQASRLLQETLHRQEEMSPLFRDLPEHAARFAEDLPRIGRELVRVLRDAGRLKEVAEVLRQTKAGIDHALEGWPDIQKRLRQQAQVLRACRERVNRALENKPEYDSALKQASLLLETTATSLPVFTEQVEHDLAEQVESLSGLEKSITEVTATLPDTAHAANRLIQLTRLLLALLSGIFALHAGFLLYESRALREKR